MEGFLSRSITSCGIADIDPENVCLTQQITTKTSVEPWRDGFSELSSHRCDSDFKATSHIVVTVISSCSYDRVAMWGIGFSTITVSRKEMVLSDVSAHEVSFGGEL